MTTQVICLSPNGEDAVSRDGATRSLAIGTIDGVFHLEREGDRWRTRSHTLRGAHVAALLYAQEENTLVAGAYSGGVFVSPDGGASWQERTNGLSQRAAYALAGRVHEGETLLYLGTEPAHLFVSRDLGRHWQELPALRAVPGTERWWFPAPPHLGHVKQICFHPSRPQTLYVCIEQGALLRSDDLGRSWHEIDSFHDAARHRYYKDVHRLRIMPAAPELMYLTGGDGLFCSRDGGKSWRQPADLQRQIGYPDDIHLSPLDVDCIVVAGAATDPSQWPEKSAAHGSVMLSTDGGAHWRDFSAGLPRPMRAHVSALTLHSHDGAFDLFLGTTDGEVYARTAASERWTLIARDLPPIAKGNHALRLPKLAAVPG